MENVLPRPLVVGAPRSGFSLLITVCNTILNMLGVQQKRPLREKMIETVVTLTGLYMREQYFRAFHQAGIEGEVIFNGEFHSLLGGPKWLDKDDPTKTCIRKYIGLKGDGDFLLITRHPREVQEFYPVVHSHDNPRLWYETSYYDRFIRLASIRNPIGIINSATFSLNALSSEYLQRFDPDHDQDKVRQRIAMYKLTDLKVVQGLVDYLKRYYDGFLPIREGYAVSRWEDLINDPINTIINIGRLIGVEVSAQVARQIWQPMDHKNLMIYHKHNFRRGKGIVGDWKNSLVAEHMELFRENGFGEYLEALGYPPIPKLDPREYSPYQKLIARHLQRGEVFSNTGDQDLFGFAFNKSNIDTSKFNFKSYPKRTWTHVERSTLDNEQVVLTVSDAIEAGCERVNPVLEETARADWQDRRAAKSAILSIEKSCRALMAQCRDRQNLQTHGRLFEQVLQGIK